VSRKLCSALPTWCFSWIGPEQILPEIGFHSLTGILRAHDAPLEASSEPAALGVWKAETLAHGSGSSSYVMASRLPDANWYVLKSAIRGRAQPVPASRHSSVGRIILGITWHNQLHLRRLGLDDILAPTRREQYANIEEAKPPQVFPHHTKSSITRAVLYQQLPLIPRALRASGFTGIGKRP
jgi:hypothetical protein